MASFKFMKTLPSAVAPCKAYPTDSGFDLTLVEKVKEENGVVFYDTGIAVEPPPGYYFELVGRSSISKTGYMLANNIGIIDNSYRGSIKVALVKHNASMPELTLPIRLVQIIPQIVRDIMPLETMDVSDTLRGNSGFGSTGR
jgi:dUTP pyrophosphatase